MLSKTGIHAVRAMVVLAELPEGVYAGAVSIAEGIQAPRNYLGKLLQLLAREGLVESQKGMGGGFGWPAPATSRCWTWWSPSNTSAAGTAASWAGTYVRKRLLRHTSPLETIREAYLELLRDTRLADLIAHPHAVIR